MRILGRIPAWAIMVCLTFWGSTVSFAYAAAMTAELLYVGGLAFMCSLSIWFTAQVRRNTGGK